LPFNAHLYKTVMAPLLLLRREEVSAWARRTRITSNPHEGGKKMRLERRRQ